MVLNNIKIGTRLGLSFAALLLLLCTVGGVALWQMSYVYKGTLKLGNELLPSVQAAGNIQANVNRVRRTSLDAILATDLQQRQAQIADHDGTVQRVKAALADYAKHVSTPEARQLYDQMNGGWANYVAIDFKVLDLLGKGNAGYNEASMLAANEGQTAFAALIKPIEADIELHRNGAVKEVGYAAQAFRVAVISTSVLIVIAMLAGLGIGAVITRSITRPIGRAVIIAETVSRGDLSAVIHVTGKDETSQLLGAMRRMNERLVDVVGRVRSSSESIATGSAQIAAGNTDLSQRTEEQAASLEETAASMEQLTATVKQNAENALQGNSLASSASEIAIRGGEVVDRVVKTMSAISNSSSQVAQIISVIEGIAFQTNILALNAAVEAARAGEQGRGFAVVAGEVRTLAQRSAAAAKEIKELISTSVEHVHSGSKLVNEAGRTMDEVVQSVERVRALMGEISAASGEQHTGIGQVNLAVMQMDQVTQQNAALVEEASAAAQSMATQSNTLRELVSVFRLPGTGAQNTKPFEQDQVTSEVAAVKDTMKVRPSADQESTGAARSVNKDWQSF
ncbi:methyl-accepting chemotaxis protein [Paraburkholderia nemoris]|uniref:methyl-accepting chemotaxis protein n=1 Tax=Paraburkholderia nemoris TaxID=2793076 RepID=UPI001B1762F4|nr:methyl-accepting chemotaxis protein [Paraburkholderia nemoris]CAE6749636.1 hypothetical protein R75777_02926 [Paraburkholderia nemoris]